MESAKIEIAAQGQTELSDVMVPNCIYRFGCPEFSMCKERFFAEFIKYCNENSLPLNTIQQRYDAYNQFFYSRKEVE